MFPFPVNLRGRAWALVALAFWCLGASPLMAQEASTEAQIDELLSKLDRGESIENLSVNLRDINFQFNSSELTTASHAYLDKVVRFMEQVPNLTLEIHGHSDNMGDPAYNLSLSEKRAESVLRYLESQGIDAGRLESKGFGMENPLESNATAAGRAKNRRVEFVVIRPETMQTIQDLIILTTGDTIGAKVLSATNAGVRYRSFRDDEEKFLNPGLVDKVIFADGRVWPEEEPVREEVVAEKPKRSGPPEIVNQLKTILFEGPAYFRNGNSTVALHGEFVDNVEDGKPYNLQNTFPGLSVSYERQVLGPIGLGLNFGLDLWGDPSQEYAYSYYAIGARWTYHPNVLGRLDPYVGGAYTYRIIRLTEPEAAPQSFTGGAYDWFFGLRYFPTRRFGVFGEFGSDAVSKLNAGLVFILGPLDSDW
jgi:outer membrane protein OmpA-like peptidoglycan-associated protein